MQEYLGTALLLAGPLLPLSGAVLAHLQGRRPDECHHAYPGMMFNLLFSSGSRAALYARLPETSQDFTFRQSPVSSAP